MATVMEPARSVVIDSVGPFVTGIWVQQMLMGVIIVQVYDYFRMFPNDTRSNKLLVLALCGISIFQTCVDFASLYRTGITYYGQYSQFDQGDWKLWSEVAITSFIGALSQLFFLERCWHATKSYLILAGGGVAITASLCAGFATSVFWGKYRKISQLKSLSVPMALWLISSAVIGIVMSIILIFRLTRAKSDFVTTEAIVTRIIRLSFTTSSLTAAVTIIDIVLYLGLSSTAWHLLPLFALGKIYTISVMVTLSSRRELRALMDGAGTTAMMSGPRGTYAASARLDFLTTPRPTVTGIKVSTTHTYHVDRNSTMDENDSERSDVKVPFDENGTSFVVHRRESVSSKKSYASSNFGPHKQDIEVDNDGELELDVISLNGHSARQRPFAPHPTVEVAVEGTDGVVRQVVRPRTADGQGYDFVTTRRIDNGSTPIVVIEESDI